MRGHASPLARHNRAICTQTTEPAIKPTQVNIRQGANPAPAGPTESITLCDGRHGIDVWPEFRERPRPARTSAPLTAGHRGTARNAAGHLPIRTTLRLVHRRRRGSARREPGAGRASGRVRSAPRRSGSLEAIRAATAAWLCVTYRCKVVSRGWLRRRGTGFRSLYEVHHHPGGRLVFHGCAALAELIRDSSWRVRAVRHHDRAARPGSGAAGLTVPRTAGPGPRRSRRKRRVRRAAEDRDLTQLRMPGFPAGTAAGRGTP